MMEFGFWEVDHQILLACIHCSTERVHNLVSTHTGAVGLGIDLLFFKVSWEKYLPLIYQLHPSQDLQL